MPEIMQADVFEARAFACLVPWIENIGEGLSGLHITEHEGALVRTVGPLGDLRRYRQKLDRLRGERNIPRLGAF